LVVVKVVKIKILLDEDVLLLTHPTGLVRLKKGFLWGGRLARPKQARRLFYVLWISFIDLSQCAFHHVYQYVIDPQLPNFPAQIRLYEL
jgi:hypothetical protein